MAKTNMMLRASTYSGMMRDLKAVTSFLEPHVLKRLGGVPVLACGGAVVPPARGEIAERDPGPGPVADR
jgi:hypothetical protein